MNSDVDLAFAAAERAGTLPRGFLRGSDAQRVLTNYQYVMRVIFGYTTEFSIIGPEGNPPADRIILNRIPRALLWAARDPGCVKTRKLSENGASGANFFTSPSL
jgi:hypothetical protein